MPPENSPLALGEPELWELSPPADAEGFLRAVANLLTSDSSLYFEGTSIAPDVAAFFRAHSSASPRHIRRGTLWPRPATFHVDYTPEVLQGLISLVNAHASPELCEHLHAYDSEGLIFCWYDAFTDNPVLLSSRVPEQSVAALAHALSASYARVRGA